MPELSRRSSDGPQGNSSQQLPVRETPGARLNCGMVGVVAVSYILYALWPPPVDVVLLIVSYAPVAAGLLSALAAAFCLVHGVAALLGEKGD